MIAAHLVGLFTLGVGSYALTALLVHYLPRLSVLDRPNARSLHIEPTPRGGGIAFVITVTTTFFLSQLPAGWKLPLVGVGLGFAVLGGVDDWRPQSPPIRLLIQFLLTAVFLHFTPAVPSAIPDPLLFLLVSLGIVWVVNLFNFMDGSDGFAAVQAILFSLGSAVLFFHAQQPIVAAFMVNLAVCVGGFLFFNWYPARIFMGDSGSYFLGFQIAAFIYLGVQAGVPLAAGLILIGPFVTDATLTLLRRIYRREPWWRAHRSHLYQRLVLSGLSPHKLVVRLATLNLLLGWFPAWCALVRPELNWLICSASYGALALLWYHAGRSLPPVD